MTSIVSGGKLSLTTKKKRKRKSSHVLAVKMIVVSDLEYIFPQDLKMWAKSAGRHFLEAQEKIKAFSSSGIPASAYWDKDNKIVVLPEE
tara:strand:- start:1711 stop:1977 length:267 start_codon:yes stop_codon:yes gene_type:complete